MDIILTVRKFYIYTNVLINIKINIYLSILFLKVLLPAPTTRNLFQYM